MKDHFILVSANQYEFKDQSGKLVRGTSLVYLPSGSMNPKVEGNRKGIQPVKASMPFEVFEEKIKDVPGIYEFTLELRSSSDGKAILIPTDIVFSRSFLPNKL